MKEIKLNFSHIALALFFFFYAILTSVFSLLPLLYGFFFCYAYVLLKESESALSRLDFRWYFSLVFLFFVDLTHDFFLFSSWLAFFIFYYVLAGWIKVNLKITKWTPILFVFSAYAFIVLLDGIFSYIFNEKLRLPHSSYPFSIGIEALLTYIFFREKI